MKHGSTRREILAALLGLPAAAACRSAPPPLEFDGGFVDDQSEAGHRLRDGLAPQDSSAPIEVPVLILGAGVAGLSAARALTKAGLQRFSILELASIPGGTACGGRSEVTAYPWGAHYVPAPHASNPELVELFREVGAVSGIAHGEPIYEEAHLVAAPKERVFYGGRWYSGLVPEIAATSRDHEDLTRFEAEIDRYVGRHDAQGRRAFTLPIARASDHASLRALDAISATDWLDRKRFKSPILRWWVDYACRDDFGARPEDTSAWYALHYFASRMRKPGEESSELLTWSNGNAHLVDHLLNAAGPERLVPDTLVARISPAADGRRAWVETWNRNTKQTRAYLAERVIFALPSFLRSRLLGAYEAAPAYPVTYGPWLVANIHLAGRPRWRGFETAWDNVIYDSKSLGYVVATHRDGSAYGKTVWTYYLPSTDPDAKRARAALLSLSWREAADTIVSELSRCHLGFGRLVERIDIRRFGHGMVRPDIGRAFSSERAQAALPVGPIHFAHTDLSGVALFEEAFFHGERAAAEVLAALGPEALR